MYDGLTNKSHGFGSLPWAGRKTFLLLMTTVWARWIARKDPQSVEAELLSGAAGWTERSYLRRSPSYPIPLQVL